MNDPTREPIGPHRIDSVDDEPVHETADDEARVRHLLEQAGSRPAVPADDLAQIKRAFRSEWKEHVERRQAAERAGFGWRLLAAAAAVTLAAGLGWGLWSLRGPAPAPPAGLAETAAAARVELALGAPGWRPSDGTAAEARPLRVGEEIPTGAVVETAAVDSGDDADRAALRLASGPSLRLDRDTRVVLLSASTLRLERGAVYLDTASHGGATDGAPLEVRTALGVARDIGTQFEVRLVDDNGGLMRVRVREGEVVLEHGARSFSAGGEEELTLHPDGSIDRRSFERHDEAWDWVVDLAPRLADEDRHLSDVLAWIARETGLTVRYADADAAAVAKTITVHGALGNLGPEEALAAVLPGAGYAWEVVGDELRVMPSR